MKQTPQEKQSETRAEDRDTFLREQAADLLMLLNGPRCNCPDPERRHELMERYLCIQAERFGLKRPPPTPLGDPDPEDG